MRECEGILFPFKDDHAKAPKRKNITLLVLLDCIFIALLVDSNEGV